MAENSDFDRISSMSEPGQSSPSLSPSTSSLVLCWFLSFSWPKFFMLAGFLVFFSLVWGLSSFCLSFVSSLSCSQWLVYHFMDPLLSDQGSLSFPSQVFPIATPIPVSTPVLTFESSCQIRSLPSDSIHLPSWFCPPFLQDKLFIYRELYSKVCGDLNGKEIQKRGNMCIHIADSLCCRAETNNIVKQIHSNKN